MDVKTRKRETFDKFFKNTCAVKRVLMPHSMTAMSKLEDLNFFTSA